MKMTIFERELRELINRHSMENESDTPDFMLANFLVRCLEAWNATTSTRSKWCSKAAHDEAPNV